MQQTGAMVVKLLQGLNDEIWLLPQEQRGQCLPPPLRPPWE
jgi:hypothetical protein